MSYRELYEHKRFVQERMVESANDWDKAYWVVVFRWIVAEIGKAQTAGTVAPE